MSVRVRQSDAHDLPALAALFDAYRQFYGQAPDAATAHAFLAARLARAESVVLLAERDAQAAGFVQLYPSFSSVRAARLWILNDLYVTPAHRRHGVAQALLHAAEGHAADDGAVRIVLETAQDNLSAQALYRACGWQQDLSAQHYAKALVP
ncbi:MULTISPECIES: GNAT family N-acetyltransferase [unclassified Xanthomonas]|uniref:GNAT family N-acetyltransferase n=1 Tax=Xanthomonas sp. LMG 9002 TaxID=1591158 RepID=UPI001368D9B2|nr:GNAT family N-acetyltransferase [Xanthomonas sp. LMG 9002]MXV07068.1 GNAT family N-acetyltransferase [Xanthomonas sp. LMG 9002]